jgi:hypothetical protein
MRRGCCVAILALSMLVLGSGCGANPRAPAATTAPTTLHPRLSTYATSARVDTGKPRSVSVSCRSGEQMLGGGFGSSDMFEYAAYMEASYPSGAATWTVTAAAPASYFYLEAEIYCIPQTIPLGLHVVYAPAATVTCPPDTVLLSGGFQSSQPISVSRPQGNGWLSAGSDATYSLCAARHMPPGRVVSTHFNAHSSSRSYAPESADVACPLGQVAVGGGFASGDLIVGSQTLGPSFAGWSVAAGGDTDVTVFAVCVLLQA